VLEEEFALGMEQNAMIRCHIMMRHGAKVVCLFSLLPVSICDPHPMHHFGNTSQHFSSCFSSPAEYAVASFCRSR
jgi:hypothetical protein